MVRHRFATAVVVLAAGLLGGCRVATLGLGENAISSGDGVGLKFNLAGKLVAVTMDGKELPAPFVRFISPGGFFIRDSGSQADQEMLGAVERLGDRLIVTGSPGGLKLRAIVESKPDRLEVRGRLINPAGNERAVIVGLSLPVHAAGWLFGRSVLHRETITPAGSYAEWTCADSDWDGRQINRGMFTPIYSEAGGLALGATPDHPQVFRVSYRPGQGLAIEIDLGLSPIPQKFPNTATFKFVLFRFDPTKGYRGALAKYYQLFPDDHAVRAKRFGNWAAAGDLAKELKVNPADYGVAFAVDEHDQEQVRRVDGGGLFGDDDSATQTASPANCDRFRYAGGFCENVPVPAGRDGLPVAPEQARRAVSLFRAALGYTSDLDASATWGPDGRMQVWATRPPSKPLQGSLYPKGGMLLTFPANPDPELEDAGDAGRFIGALRGSPPVTGCFIDRLTDAGGRYLDNHRPSHWRVIDYPLAFSYRTGRPAQFHAFMAQELLRPLAEYLHSQEMLLMASVRPSRAGVMFDQGLIDVFVGSEGPERDLDNLAFLRSLVGGKVICGAGVGQLTPGQEKNYSARELAQLERDLNILLPYCWFPGGVGPKELWQRYCRPMQEMAAAGWQPLAGAVLVHPDLVVERYGGPGNEKVFYAVHNRGERHVAYELAIDLACVQMDPGTVAVIDRLTGKAPEATIVDQSLVLRQQVGGRGTNLFQLARTGGQVKANVELATPLSPAKSSVARHGRFDPARSASARFKATMAELDLRPRTAGRFLAAYEQERSELASAVAFHLRRENVAADLDKAAGELANWLAPRFTSIYESALPGPGLAAWAALRGHYKDRAAWRLSASAKLVGDELQVRVWDPLLEKD